jgi:hypothetical protein
MRFIDMHRSSRPAERLSWYPCDSGDRALNRFEPAIQPSSSDRTSRRDCWGTTPTNLACSRRYFITARTPPSVFGSTWASSTLTALNCAHSTSCTASKASSVMLASYFSAAFRCASAIRWRSMRAKTAESSWPVMTLLHGSANLPPDIRDPWSGRLSHHTSRRAACTVPALHRNLDGRAAVRSL